MESGLRFLGFFLVGLIFNVHSYSDNEFKCASTKERVIRFSGIKDKDGKRSYSFACKPFTDGDKIKNPTCKYRKPYNCNNLREGCEKNEWLGGAKSFDMGAGTPMLIPYCCSAENVEIDNCGKSEQVNRRQSLKEMFWQEVKSTEVGLITRCVLVLEKNTKDTKVVDALFKFQKCNYKINKKYPPGISQKSNGDAEANDPAITDDCGCSPEKCLHDTKDKCKKGKVEVKSKKRSKRESKSCKLCVCNVNC